MIAGLLQGPFLTGDLLSIADIMIASHMSMLAGTPECREILATHPPLADWLARMEARPSMQKTDLLKRQAA